MFIRAARRSRRWFPERGCILEHQIFSFGKMILRARCSTSYDLASLFRGRCGSLDRWSGKIAKRTGTRPSALHWTFHFWRTSRRIASFLMLSTWRRIASFLTLSSSKIEEVSLDCCVFDVFKFKKLKLRKSRRIQNQNSFVFKLADRQRDRETTTTATTTTSTTTLHYTTTTTATTATTATTTTATTATTTTSANILRYITQH